MKSHVLGIGKTAITYGNRKDCKTKFISFLEIEEEPIKIGTDILETPLNLGEPTYIFVKNLEGLAVLEKLIKALKKDLKKEKKLL
jgi:hypothetical protein